MPVVDCNGAEFVYDELPSSRKETGRLFVWGHGWGQNRHAFAPLAQSMTGFGRQVLLDFPGFGDSPRPSGDWGTAEYADATAQFIAKLGKNDQVIWVGHSFGCRVGIQLAARHPAAVQRLCLVAAAGLPRRRSLAEKASLNGRIYTFKALKRLAPLLGLDIDSLRKKFGSSDYRSAGDMREIFVRVVRENLEEQARKVTCPVHLIYGANDTETPPEIGRRFSKMIPDASITVLEAQDHYSVLKEGRHQVAKLLHDFVKDA